MTAPAQDVFEFWEASLSESYIPDAPHVDDAVSLSLELQNGDWSEPEAAAELAQRCGLESLRSAQTQLLATLHASPVLLPREICACRIIWLALDIAAGSGSR